MVRFVSPDFQQLYFNIFYDDFIVVGVFYNLQSRELLVINATYDSLDYQSDCRVLDADGRTVARPDC